MRFSDLATPPISDAEAKSAPYSICVLHEGLIGRFGDVEGRVFYCPIGKMYFRYATKGRNSFTRPLNYPKVKVV